MAAASGHVPTARKLPGNNGDANIQSPIGLQFNSYAALTSKGWNLSECFPADIDGNVCCPPPILTIPSRI
jgi:hypothetical protein